MRNRYLQAALMIAASAFLFTACGRGNAPIETGASSEDRYTSEGVSYYVNGSDASTGSHSSKDTEPEYTYTLRLASLEGRPITKGSPAYSLIKAHNLAHPDHAVENALPAGFKWDEKAAVKTSLMADINEGKGPDIFFLEYEDLMDLGEKGKLLSLEELLPGIKSELIPAVAELGTVNGEFVGLAPVIDRIYTCVVPKKYHKEGTWTISDVLDIMDANPDLKRTFIPKREFNNYDRPLKYCIAYGLNLTDSGFVDTVSGKTDFYSEDFVRLLERMAEDSKHPDDYGFFKETYLMSYEEPTSMLDLLKMFINLGEDYELVGLPMRESSGNRFSVPSYIAVNKDCKDPDAAREFVKRALYYVPVADQFPVRTDGIGNSLQFMEPPKDGTPGKLGYAVYDADGALYGWTTVGEYEGDIDTLKSRYERFVTDLKPYDSDPMITDALIYHIKNYINNSGDADATAMIIDETVQALFDEESVTR